MENCVLAQLYLLNCKAVVPSCKATEYLEKRIINLSYYYYYYHHLLFHFHDFQQQRSFFHTRKQSKQTDMRAAGHSLATHTAQGRTHTLTRQYCCAFPVNCAVLMSFAYSAQTPRQADRRTLHGEPNRKNLCTFPLPGRPGQTTSRTGCASFGSNAGRPGQYGTVGNPTWQRPNFYCCDTGGPQERGWPLTRDQWIAG